MLRLHVVEVKSMAEWGFEAPDHEIRMGGDSMYGNERREKIRKDLKKSLKAIKGSEFAKKYKVSRQVIVQDIALLRAVGEQILSTAGGYIYFSFHMDKPKRVFAVKHTTADISKEISAVIRSGGTLLNVFITHPIYGDLVADMIIGDKKQMNEYVGKCEKVKFIPLMALTGEVHYHTVEASCEDNLDEIEKSLEDLGFLL